MYISSRDILRKVLEDDTIFVQFSAIVSGKLKDGNFPRFKDIKLEAFDKDGNKIDAKFKYSIYDKAGEGKEIVQE